GCFDFKDVAILCLDAIGEGQCCGSEHVDMDIAGLAENRIFEMMMFEIGNGVGHVVFTRQERFFPDRFALAQDTRTAANIGRQIPDDQFRSQGAGAQFGVSQKEIIDTLGDMIGEFIGQCKADAERRAVGTDHIDTGNLRF
ncbi:hypothetical protein BLX88_20975, partial [Bacillus obstructivus]